VLRSQFSQAGGGKLAIWVNGVEVYPWQDCAIGLATANTEGVGPHYGFYGANTRNTITIERANVEFGTDDLSSRIAKPLPI
jgi:hypothetical protein